MSINLSIPYSGQYSALNLEGHEHPPPLFGAPTLVWHLALSPHWDEREIDASRELNLIHGELARIYEQTRTAFFRDINQLLQRLHRAAGYPDKPIEPFDPEHIPAPWQQRPAGTSEPFYVTKPGSVRFTLWWQDDNRKPDAAPTSDALRVKVHASAHRDYVMLSFFLDVAKPWDALPQTRPSDATGRRRRDILTKIDHVRSMAAARMVPDAQGLREVDREILPEHGVSATQATALLDASRTFHAGVWDEFCEAMGVDRMPALGTARIFANFRGLVMATDGLPEAIENRAFPGSSGADPFPRFQGNGSIDHTGARSSPGPNEANAVVKAFWPFIRRTTPDADRKEFVACGVMSWRALYITTLNCPPSFEWAEEARNADTQIPAGELPDAGGRDTGPIHFLLITKGEPHRRQIGRIVERINAMGTMRLIALRDYNIIRDASTHIQLRGQELDKMMTRWCRDRLATKDRFDKERKAKQRSETEIKDDEDIALQRLADNMERDLIALSAALDKIGDKAVHGLPFRINRSRYYISEFMSLLESLVIGNIDTWVAYDQFVKRGLKPTFDFIDGVGERLVGLRTRLQTVLEAIETGALVTQTSATRQNTMALRRIADSFYNANFWLRVMGLTVAVASTLIALFGMQGILKGIWGWLNP